MTSALATTTPESVALSSSHAGRMRILRPLASPTDILAAQEETRAFLAAALVEGRDYGVFPGVDKKSLFKAGAERSALAFGLMSRFRIVEKEVDHDRPVPWRKVKAKYEGPRGNRVKVGEEITEGASLGLYRYVVECELLGRDTGEIVGSAVASCSTMESKYIDRPRDSENTVLQMAEKRAFVAATRTALGLSEQFTQDIEDDPDRFAKKDGAADDDAVKCPKCRGAMWDNRAKNDEREKEGKKRMPDYKCKDPKCEGVIWDAKKYAEELAANDAVAAKRNEAATAEKPLPATEHQIARILECCDHTAISEDLVDNVRARLARGVTTARADEILVGLETQIKAATPAKLPAREGEQRSDPTMLSPTSTGPAEVPATTSEPTVVQLQQAADVAAEDARQTSIRLTTRLHELLFSKRIASEVQTRVRQRLAGSLEHSHEVLEAAIAELENVEAPF